MALCHGQFSDKPASSRRCTNQTGTNHDRGNSFANPIGVPDHWTQNRRGTPAKRSATHIRHRILWGLSCRLKKNASDAALGGRRPATDREAGQTESGGRVQRHRPRLRIRVKNSRCCVSPSQAETLNGRAWPHTERITHDLGEEVRWRGVNLSTQGHPMHLHGFYFDVEREGNETHDGTIAPRRRIREVTHLLAPGSTMSMIWTPERAGRGFSTVTLCCTCHRH